MGDFKFYTMRLTQVIAKLPLFLIAGILFPFTALYRGIVLLILKIDNWWWR